MHADLFDFFDFTLNQVNSIEQELLSLIRLHHPNLVHYLAIKYQQDPGKITVYVSQSVDNKHYRC